MYLKIFGDLLLPLDNVFNIFNTEEAISCLNTEMYAIAIDYLSDHLIELIESGEMMNLNNQIVFTIIDKLAGNEGEKSERK